MKKFIRSGFVHSPEGGPEDRFIINCLRTKYAEQNHDDMAQVDLASLDWNRVYQRSVQWNVTPLLYQIIKKHFSYLWQLPGTSQEFLQNIKIDYLRTSLDNETNFQGLIRVINTFTQEGVKTILLKGAHLAQFVYQDAGLRPMADVDLLVKREDVDKSEQLLLQRGYNYPSLPKTVYDYFKVSQDAEGPATLITRYKTTHFHLHPFSHVKEIRDLEIHWAIIDPGAPFNIDTEGLWKRAKSLSINGTDVLVLSPEDLLLHLSLHNSYQYKFDLFGMKTCCDFAATVNHYYHELDWDQLQLRAQEWGAQRYLYLTSVLSREILGLRLPSQICDDHKAMKLNEKIFLEAKERIIYGESKKLALRGMRYAPKINFFNQKDKPLNQVSLLFKSLFISRKELASRYSLPTFSRRVNAYFFLRLITLLHSYLKVFIPYFLYWLVHRKEQFSNYNLDAWLNPPHSVKRR